MPAMSAVSRYERCEERRFHQDRGSAAYATVFSPRFRTPHYAILLTGTVMLALALSGTFIYALTISTLARLAIYITTCAALPVLRRKPEAPRAMWQVPGGTGIAGAAVLLGLWLLSNSTWHEARDTAIAAAVGLAVFAASKARRAANPL